MLASVGPNVACVRKRAASDDVGVSETEDGGGAPAGAGSLGASSPEHAASAAAMNAANAAFRRAPDRVCFRTPGE